jgi:type I site-specific restriction-modification system R (restriction) subunit
MLFHAARIVRHPAMQNPTLVVLADRNDLDDQLFGQFQRCHEIGEDFTFEDKMKKPTLSLRALSDQNSHMAFDNTNTAQRDSASSQSEATLRSLKGNRGDISIYGEPLG